MQWINVYSLASALINSGADFFSRHTIDARACLASIKDSSELLSILLAGGHSARAGRIAGAFRNIGNEKIADEILKTMRSASYDVRETDPFEEKLVALVATRESTPFVNRIKLMWSQMLIILFQ